MGTVLAVSALLVMDNLVVWLGATPTIAPYAKAYANYIVVGFPFIMGSFGLNNILRFQGNSNLGAVGMMTGGILNVILDPIFIFTLGLGTQGAAIATTLSQIISFSILVFMSNHNPSALKIKLRRFRPTWTMYKKIIHIGMPSLARQGIMSLSTIIFNHAAQPYGDACIAASSIVNRYMNLLNGVVIGMGQGFQPVCGTNMGADKKDRVLEAFYFYVKLAIGFLVIMAVISFVFARPIITLFRKDDMDVINIGTTFLRYQSLTLPILALIHGTNMFSQSAGYGFRASLMASLRSGICLIPLVVLLPPFFGVKGLQMAQPIADIISAIIGYLIVRTIIREMKEDIRRKQAGKAQE